MKTFILTLIMLFFINNAYAFDCNYRDNTPSSTSGWGGTDYGFAINNIQKMQEMQQYKSPEISVFCEEKKVNSPGGHIGIRFDDTLYEIHRISKGNGIWQTRPYSDLINSPRKEEEVPVNFLSYDQAIQLQQNIINSVGNKTLYEWDNNNCVNTLKDHFGKVGVLFPNNIIDTPYRMLEETQMMNQTYHTPDNWREIGNNFTTTSYDIKMDKINTLSNIQTGIARGIGAIVAPQLLPYISTPITSPSRFQPTFPSMPINRYDTFKELNRNYDQFKQIYNTPAPAYNYKAPAFNTYKPIVPVIPKDPPMPITLPSPINPFGFDNSITRITR